MRAYLAYRWTRLSFIKRRPLFNKSFFSYRRDSENLGFRAARTGPRAIQKKTPRE